MRQIRNLGASLAHCDEPHGGGRPSWVRVHPAVLCCMYSPFSPPLLSYQLFPALSGKRTKIKQSENEDWPKHS